MVGLTDCEANYLLVRNFVLNIVTLQLLTS